jgi:hypothetical protein
MSIKLSRWTKQICSLIVFTIRWYSFNEAVVGIKYVDKKILINSITKVRSTRQTSTQTFPLLQIIHEYWKSLQTNSRYFLVSWTFDHDQFLTLTKASGRQCSCAYWESKQTSKVVFTEFTTRKGDISPMKVKSQLKKLWHVSNTKILLFISCRLKGFYCAYCPSSNWWVPTVVYIVTSSRCT